jgi:hypothetical protein
MCLGFYGLKSTVWKLRENNTLNYGRQPSVRTALAAVITLILLSANSLASLLTVVQRHAEDQVVVLAAQTDAFIATSARLSSTASRATVSTAVGALEKETRAQVKRARAGFGRPSPCTDLPCASSRPASAILDGPPVPPPQYIDAFAFAGIGAGGGPRLAQQPRKKKGRKKIARTFNLFS